MGQLLTSVAKHALHSDSSHGGHHHHQTSHHGGSPGNGPELRERANAEFQASKKCSADSQAAWQRGDKALAGELSHQSKAHRAKAEALNQQASDAVFYSHNPNYPGGYEQIDLHGLFVTEAIQRVEDHLVACRERGVTRTRIITGRGLHSEGGVAKIKPEVERLMHSQGIHVTESSQGGALEVELPAGHGGEGLPKKSGFRALLKTILKALLSGGAKN